MPQEDDPRAVVGRRLRQLREARRLSQEELGHRAGLDRTYVSSCERGQRNLSVVAIFRLAHGLDVPPAALLDPPDIDEART